MNIPFLKFDQTNKLQVDSFVDVLKKMIHNSSYILGENVLSFEENYAKYSESKYCIGVANGLDAITLSLKALNIGPGDDVIVPSNTYIATWLAVSNVGAKIIPVEPRFETGNLNPELIENAITRNTKAIIVVNLYGQSAELNLIKNICDKYSIFLIEDNAQSQGALCNGKKTGSFGIINATSFYPGKNLGALGDGGAITTNSLELYDRLRVLRNYGSKIKYYNEEIGYNSRLDEIQAGFLDIKLKNLDYENSLRFNAAQLYINKLKEIPQITIPKIAKNCTSVYHIFYILTSSRDKLISFLKENGISCMIHYPVPPHLQQAYADLGFSIQNFPIAEKIASMTISLPIYPGISDDEIEYVCSKIKKYFTI
jgi:dTDP-4-amino-4,6-dideoxygalactose transaminase